MKSNRLKQIILTAIIQLMAIAVYSVSILRMIKVEYIVLNPVRYFVGVGFVVLIINTLVLLFVFREKAVITQELMELETASSTEDNIDHDILKDKDLQKQSEESQESQESQKLGESNDIESTQVSVIE